MEDEEDELMLLLDIMDEALLEDLLRSGEEVFRKLWTQRARAVPRLPGQRDWAP